MSPQVSSHGIFQDNFDLFFYARIQIHLPSESVAPVHQEEWAKSPASYCEELVENVQPKQQGKIQYSPI